MAQRFDSPTAGSVAPPADPMIGRQVRDLRIVECLGRGGMGAVYKAEHVLLHEPRALKMMRAELFQGVPDALERFTREARIAVKLHHPNLVTVHDFFVEGGDHFLVMEYVAGKSLGAYLRERGSLSVVEVCRIGIECCSGLAHAHEMGVVHRDLSPENVMLTTGKDGLHAKIIDFGVARAVVGAGPAAAVNEDLTQAHQFIGKPRWASPEQAGTLRRGESLDHRSDLYTLGLILYKMLTGDFPFQSDTAMGFLTLHALEVPTPPTQVRPDLVIPARLERVILRCLEKDRNDRFGSARELGAALERVLASAQRFEASGVTTHVEPPLEETLVYDEEEDDTGRRRVLLVAAMLLLAALGGATWWALRDTDAPGRPTPAAVAPPVPAPQEPAPTSAAPPPEPEPVKEVAPAPAPAAAEALPAPAEAPLVPPAPPSGPAPTPAPAAGTTAPAPETPAATLAPAAVASREPATPVLETPRAEVAPVAEPSPHVEPAPSPAAAPKAAATPKPEPKREPKPEPKPVAKVEPKPPRPAPRAEPAPRPAASPAPHAVAFSDTAEMQRAFDDAVAFERGHDARASIENWKRFRSRGPSRDLDEWAKRRITQLTLGNLGEIR